MNLPEAGRLVSWQKLPQRYQRLLCEAEKAMERAYSPSSGFSVGAAVLTKSGKIFTGANYEVASYDGSVCAERAAWTAANTQGYGAEGRAIAVITRGRDSPTREVSGSCFGCCQMSVEAASRADYDLEVILSTTLRDKIRIAKISELLPLAFGPSDLEKNQPPVGEALAQAAS